MPIVLFPQATRSTPSGVPVKIRFFGLQFPSSKAYVLLSTPTDLHRLPIAFFQPNGGEHLLGMAWKFGVLQPAEVPRVLFQYVRYAFSLVFAE